MITIEDSKNICKQLDYPYYVYTLILDFSNKYDWADMQFFYRLIEIKTKPIHKLIIPSFEPDTNKSIDPFIERLCLFDLIVVNSIDILSLLRKLDNECLE